jgi:ribokinase
MVAREGRTGRVYVLLDEDGERRNLVWPAANDDFSVADLPRRPPRTRFALFTSFVGDVPLEAQLALLERLPAETQVAFDPGEIYARKGVKRFLPILQRCSYLFANERELEMLCGLSLPESVDFVLSAGVNVVVCKMGSRGARLIGRRMDLYVPPQPAEVADVTGAGDVFAAGFLAALIEQVGLESAGRLGAWAAGRGIAGAGRSTYPDAAAWRERLAQERDAG